MKKIVSILLLFIGFMGYSQTNGITYQAVIFNPSGEQLPGVNNANAPLANKNICLRFTIIDHNSQPEYIESIQTTTDEFGMVNLIIGTGLQLGGYATSFSNILWNANPKNLKVDLSATGVCAYYTEISNQPFTSVPFALYAVNSESTAAIAALQATVAANATATTAALATKENTANKSTTTTLGTSNVLFPTQNAVKTYVDTNISTVNASTTALQATVAANAAATTTALGLKEDAANKSTTTTLGTSNVLFPTQNAVKTYVDTNISTSNTANTAAITTLGNTVTSNATATTAALGLKEDAINKSTTTTLGTSNVLFPTQNAVKTYVDTNITTVNASNTAAITTLGNTVTANAAATTTALGLKEDAANKSTTTTLGTSNVLFPTQNAVKTYVDTNITTVNASNTAAITTLGNTVTANAAATTTALGLKEDAANKSTTTTLGTSNVLFPTQNAVKTYVDAQISSATIADADATTKGKIQLAGDLTGTAAVPVVANNAIITAKIADASVTDPKIVGVSGSKVTGNISGSAANVTGIVPVANGGTGVTTVAGIKSVLGFNSPSVAIGDQAGQTNQGSSTVGVGGGAGATNQGGGSVAVGYVAGYNNQGNASVAIGSNAAQSNQGTQAVAVGYAAGQNGQGAYSVAVGSFAGNSQAANSIALNATGAPLNPQSTGFYVAPVRNASESNSLFYNTTTKEITYGTAAPTGPLNLATGVTSTLPIANGGTGATNAASALSNLGAAPIASPTFTGTVTSPIYASTPQALTDAATIVWNPANGLNASVTLGGNRTLSFTATPAVGSYGTLIVTQDATGGRTINLPSTSNKVLGSTSTTTIALSSAANAKDILNFYYDGTNCYWNIGQGYGSAATVASTNLASGVSGTLPVANGGSGAATLTGYIKGNGTSAMTANASIPVADVTGAAPLASPTFTGTPVAPTATAGTNTTQIATTEFVTGAVASATITDATTTAKGKLQLAGDLAGTADAPTVPGLALKAPLASPTFTGAVTAPIYASTPQALTDAATISWNPANGLNASVTLGGNRTLNFTTTPAVGSYGTLVITQDATGGRTITLPSTANKVLGSTSTTTVTLSSAAGAKDILNFYYDGTNCYWNVGQGYGTAATVASTNLASSVSGTLPVANGGTGATTLTANNVLLGNGTSALQVVAPGASGNVLTSNGTTWSSTAPAASGVPYTGATQAVDLGAYDLKVNGLTVGKGKKDSDGTAYVYNSAFGIDALKNFSAGTKNTALGFNALSSVTNTNQNIAIGAYAMGSTTADFQQSVAVGNQSLQYNKGSFNTALGSNAVSSSNLTNTATYLVGVGALALFNNSSGQNNTAVGSYALSTNTTGNNNTALGQGADVTTANLSNSTAIGYDAKVSANNTIQLGNNSVTNVKTNGTLTAGNVTYPNAHNSVAGQVLTTNASGVAFWSSPTATASSLSGTVAVANGGTGTTALTGYVKGNGTSAMTASANIPVADVSGAAPLASPAFTGTPTAPTAAANTNTTQIATTAFVTSALTTAGLPSQSGNNGKFLTTNGTTASWASGVSGSGTLNYIPRFSSSSALSNSSLSDDGTGLRIGNPNGTGGIYTGLSSYDNTRLMVSGGREYESIRMTFPGDPYNNELSFNWYGSAWRMRTERSSGEITDLSFWKTTGAGVTTEKMRIDDSGYVKATGFKTQSGTSSQFLKANGTVDNSNYLSGTVSVANGGTGTTSLTGYVKGNGTSAMTANATIPVADISGTLSVANGGSGAATLTGLVKGNGTNAMTAAVAGTDYLAPNGSAASLTNFPTLNQNTTGNAANVTGIVAVANGGTGTTNGSITGTTALSFAAGGSNQNVSILPSGTGSVGIGTNSPNSSAILDASSTTKGFLPPRMTYAQKMAIASPPQGLMIYCTNCGTNGEPEYYNGVAWVNMAGGAAASVPITLGSTYGGGIVFYIFQPSDPGYVAGETHGLIAATSDIPSNTYRIFPSCYANYGTSTALGTGAVNTTKILACTADNVNAAKLVDALTDGGYTDWYLPSKDELNKLYLNRNLVGNFTDWIGWYWSSSEFYLAPASHAWFQRFTDGSQDGEGKGYQKGIRAIRTF